MAVPKWTGKPSPLRLPGDPTAHGKTPERVREYADSIKRNNARRDTGTVVPSLDDAIKNTIKRRPGLDMPS